MHVIIRYKLDIAATGCILQTLTKEAFDNTAKNGTVLHVFVCMREKEVGCDIHYQVSFLGVG